MTKRRERSAAGKPRYRGRWWYERRGKAPVRDCTAFGKEHAKPVTYEVYNHLTGEFNMVVRSQKMCCWQAALEAWTQASLGFNQTSARP